MAEIAPQPSEQETSSSSPTTENSSPETTAGCSQEPGKTNARSGEINIEPAGLDESCQNMFKKISEYLQCELNG